MTSSISVIIPTCDEEANIASCLARLHHEDLAEVIVADGASGDATAQIAARMGALVFVGYRGRGPQQNLGAARAQGDILLFLHADTRLAAGFAGPVRRLLADRTVAAGAFRLRLDGPGFGLRLVEHGANLRSRFFGLPYGDQAIFMRRTTFLAAGGFRELTVMEDFDLLRRLRRLGSIRILSESAVSSARRWHNLGIVRTTFINQMMIAGFLFGVAPERLRRWYGRRKNAPGNLPRS